MLNMPELTAFDVRLLCEALMKKRRCAVIAFGSAGEGCCYSTACSEGVKLHAGEVCKAVNAAVNGKGGGNASFANGSGKERVTEELCSMLRGYLEKAFKEAEK